MTKYKTTIITALLTLATFAVHADPVTQWGSKLPPITQQQEKVRAWTMNEVAAMALLDEGAVTAPDPSVLANVVQSSVTNATFLISVGMVVNNNATAAGNLENRLELGYVLPVANNEFFIYAGIQNAATSGIIDLEAGGFGVRKIMANNAEVYAKVGAEHSSASKAWDAAFTVGISYAPGAASTSTILSGSLYCEEAAVHLFNGQNNSQNADYLRTIAGYRFNL
jgi:hypothetical protein